MSSDLGNKGLGFRASRISLTRFFRIGLSSNWSIWRIVMRNKCLQARTGALWQSGKIFREYPWGEGGPNHSDHHLLWPVWSYGGCCFRWWVTYLSPEYSLCSSCLKFKCLEVHLHCSRVSNSVVHWWIVSLSSGGRRRWGCASGSRVWNVWVLHHTCRRNTCKFASVDWAIHNQPIQL